MVKVLPTGKFLKEQEEEPLKDWKTLSHVKWNCKYHIVFITKHRHKKIYGEVRKKIGKIIRNLCEQKGIELHEGHAMSDHVHLCLSILPKFSVPTQLDL